MSDLFEHFMELGLEAHMFASQWFLTLFTAKFPLYMVFHILDIFLSEVRSLLVVLGFLFHVLRYCQNMKCLILIGYHKFLSRAKMLYLMWLWRC